MSLTLVHATSSHALATTHLDVKGTPVEVLVVGKAAAFASGELADQGRYYLSPLIAKTALEDLEGGKGHSPVFEGRSQGEMLNFLVKNAK